jgi:hypothetical protein
VTSYLSEDDLEDELVRAGIVSPYIRKRLLRLIRAYASKFPVPPEDDDSWVPFVSRGSQYKCSWCKEMKYLDEFPLRKHENTRVRVPCLECKPESLTSGSTAETII